MNSLAVYNDLKKDILYLDLEPGTMISELQISEKYGISRTPIRDAIKALVSEGFLEVRPHIGSFVSLIDLNKVSDSVFIRHSLELSVLKELCPNFTSYYALALEQLLNQQEQLVNRTDTQEAQWDFIQLDNAFHAKLFELAGKASVWNTITSMNQHYLRFRTLLVRYNSDPIDILYQQHRELLNALIARDWHNLEKKTSQHITAGFSRCGEVMTKHNAYFCNTTIL